MKKIVLLIKKSASKQTKNRIKSAIHYIPDSVVCKEAVKTFGKTAQIIMAMEEMSELIQALSKNLCGRDNIENIAEEIADVEIMLEQLREMFGCSEQVQCFYREKLVALKKRIDKQKQEHTTTIREQLEAEEMRTFSGPFETQGYRNGIKAAKRIFGDALDKADRKPAFGECPHCGHEWTEEDYALGIEYCYKCGQHVECYPF